MYWCCFIEPNLSEIFPIKICKKRSSCCGLAVMNVTSIYEDVSLISSLAWWVKNLVLPWAIVQFADMAQIHVGVAGGGRQLQLQFNPSLGISICQKCCPKKKKKSKIKKKINQSIHKRSNYHFTEGGSVPKHGVHAGMTILQDHIRYYST